MSHNFATPRDSVSELTNDISPAFAGSALNGVPEHAPIELVDFASVASRPRHIEITQRVTSGPVTIGRYLMPPNQGLFLGPTQFAVVVNEDPPAEMEWLHPRGKGYERRYIERGNIDILPTDTLSYKRQEAFSRTIFIAIDRTFVERIAGEVFGRGTMELKPYLGVRDTVIEGMAEAWQEELEVRGAGGRIQSEALGTALIVHLFRTYGEGGATPRTITGGMSSMRLRRVVDYIESHLSEDIGLGSLASVAGFSVHHFSDVFKAQTGFGPHRFLIERRIHRAKELLLTNDAPIAQIAVELGFSGQSHFTQHFRKLTGTTPLNFRRTRK